jgi:pilus assembly protein CpaF
MAAKLPDANESTNTGAGEEAAAAPPTDDEEDFGLAAKPPRAGRVPPPPPPPPRRPPTPISSRALDDDEALGDDLAPPSPAEVSAADDSTNNVGLFERRKTADHAALEAPRPSTGSRAAMLPSEPAPLPAVPGQATTTAADFLSAAADAATSGDGLESLLTDPGVTQIVIAGPDATYVDRGQGLTAYAPSLGDPNTVADTLWRLANSTVPPPSPDNPIVDVRFPDGTRLSAVFPPVSPSGVVGSIRRPLAGERALVDLVPPGAKDVQTLLEAAVAGRRNLLLTGDVGALPTLAAALAALIPGDRRVVSIGGHAARTRAGWTELQPSADVAGLVRVAAAFRAEHLLVGDTVGPEVADLLFAAARGQDGLMVAVPARTVGEGLARVEALATPAFGAGGAAAVAPLVSSTIDLAVHVVANADGTARIVDIAEPKVDAGRVGSDLVATWRSDSGRRGEGAGKLQVTGVSARLGAALGAVGQSLPGNLVRR